MSKFDQTATENERTQILDAAIPTAETVRRVGHALFAADGQQILHALSESHTTTAAIVKYQAFLAGQHRTSMILRGWS